MVHDYIEAYNTFLKSTMNENLEVKLKIKDKFFIEHTEMLLTKNKINFFVIEGVFTIIYPFKFNEKFLINIQKEFKCLR